MGAALEPFARLIAGEDARIDLARACLLIAQDAYPELDIELVGKSVWYVNQQHATNYQVGRVLCGGDAPLLAADAVIGRCSRDRRLGAGEPTTCRRRQGVGSGNNSGGSSSLGRRVAA